MFFELQKSFNDLAEFHQPMKVEESSSNAKIFQQININGKETTGLRRVIVNE